VANATLLFAVSEHLHYCKTGGLADVAAALPKALARYYDVTVMLPLYSTFKKPPAATKVAQCTLTIHDRAYHFTFFHLSSSDVNTLFVHEERLSYVKSIYEGDTALRFALFSHAIAWYATHNPFNQLYLNDWHCALAALFAKERHFNGAIHFSIHNILFQGIYALQEAPRLGISSQYLSYEGLEFFGQLNFMKAGIIFSELITTVSQSYANALLHEPKAHGLASTLRYYKHKFFGVQNGLDTQEFNPKTDKHLIATYDENALSSRQKNRAYLHKRFGFTPKLPLVTFIGRLSEQKGVPKLLAWLEQNTLQAFNLLIIGEGDPQLATKLSVLASEHAHLLFFDGYDEMLSRNVYGGTDFLLMPSQFEPSGLNQLIAMHYGAVVIAHDIDGLHDTLHPSNDAIHHQRAILMPALTPEHFTAAFDEALALYQDRPKLQALQRYTMQLTLNWERSAARYYELMQHAISRRENG